MINFYNLTFKELIHGANINFSDPYHIASSLCPEMKDALLHNPSGFQPDEVCQILALDDDTVIGCTNPYSGRIKIDGEISIVQNGSYLFAHEGYRKENIGGELFMTISSIHPSKKCYFSGISHMAMGLYHALKYTIFEYPRMIYLKNCKSVVKSLFHTQSDIVMPIVWIGNAALWLHRYILRLSNRLCRNDYTIKQVDSVPQDVIDIVNADAHPFTEYHDREWFEWCLKYKFTEQPRIKRLFLIKKGNKTEGFFLTKEQFYEQASGRGFKNVTLGSVMEWGIASDSQLSEKDIYLLAIDSFSPDVDGIVYATTDKTISHSLRKWLFIGIGTANAAFKFKGNKDPRLKDINNWRIRLAASDTLLN